MGRGLYFSVVTCTWGEWMGTTGRKLESAKKGRRTVIDHRRRDGRRDGAIKMSLKKIESRFVRKPAPRRFASRESIMALLLRGAGPQTDS
jgi:hypothetical protein